MKIEIIESPDKELMDFFENKIEEFNVAAWEIKKKIPLAVKIHKDGVILGGASAKTFGLWLLIENIWVSEALRGQNLGTKILQMLEAEAIKRGCQFSLLDTLNFQAMPFYEKFGYKVQWIPSDVRTQAFESFKGSEILFLQNYSEDNSQKR